MKNSIHRREFLGASTALLAGLASSPLSRSFAWADEKPKGEAKLPYKYAVVASKATAQDKEWAKVVEKLKEKHQARVFEYANNVNDAQGGLKEFFPRYVCLVARPEELGRNGQLVSETAAMLGKLDDDPYDDAIWAVLTGRDSADALKVIAAPPLVVKKGLSHVGGGWLDMFEEGLSFSEGEKNAKFLKQTGKNVEKVKGPDDTTEEFMQALNTNTFDIVSSSGHATEKDWQMGYSFKSGEIRSGEGGSLYALDANKKRYDIKTDNPKLYYSPGNCLIGHASHKDCMALSWIHNGVMQFFGHTIPQGRSCYAWAIADYFFGLQDKYTYAEAVYLHWQAMLFEVMELGKDFPCCLHRKRRRSTVLYGDPAWEARMKKTVDPIYGHDLSIAPQEDGKTSKIVFKITATRDGGLGRPAMALLPQRIRNHKVTASQAKKAVVTDNFILMHLGDEALKKGDTRSVEVTAEVVKE